MTEAHSRSTWGLPGWLRRPLGWLRRGAGGVLSFLALAWSTLAVYYSNLPWPWARLALAVALAAFGTWALWLTRRPWMRLFFAALFLGVVGWFATIQPTHLRPFRPEVAVMPRASIEGDRVRTTAFRNFSYRSVDDFTVRHETRDVLLSHLRGLDLYVSYWMPGPVAHTFVSFEFDEAAPVCISIEAKPEIGEGFAPVASMFKQLDLIYAVGDERDLVGVRTNHRSEEVFLYRIKVAPAAARQLFLVYLQRINELADHPEFYHLLKNSCTVNIVRYANAAGREGRWDLRHLLNGWVDRYLFRAGLIDTTLPFEETRERARINDAARQAGDGEDFSERIRAALLPAAAQ